ncbi:MAG: Cof-type HAD-IIB family hydrolase [Chloroflexota bacterium]|nr:Cof-type HAD-IIB family hydrolase [Chloroflexota bacterium]
MTEKNKAAPKTPVNKTETMTPPTTETQSPVSESPRQPIPAASTIPASATPASTHRIDLVAIDIDGTLLDSKSEMTPGVEAAVKAASAQGVRFVAATGKTRGSVLPFFKRLGIDMPGIFVQGTVTHNADGGVRSQVTLPDTIVRQVITFIEDRGFAAAVYSGERILLRAPHQRILDSMRYYHEIEPEVVGALQNLIGVESINKVIAMGDPRAITALRWQLNLQIGTAARVIQAGVPDMLEIIPNGVSKASALKRLAFELNIPPERIMAIGDAENDIEMLQFAGLGVAMGHADERVKAAANHVVASNNDDGVAEALHRFVIVKPPTPPTPPTPEPAAPIAAPVTAAVAETKTSDTAPPPSVQSPSTVTPDVSKGESAS